jgi:6-phosphogluconolactonase
MSSAPRVTIHPDFEVLAAATAARLITRLADIQSERGEATVVLTGGNVGTATLRAVANSPACRAVDWSRINFWWGDERFVPGGHEERNERQARQALLAHIPVDPGRVHPFGSADQNNDVDAAAAAYADELQAAARQEAGSWEDATTAHPLPRFDVLLLGVGSDAHIASLFPEMAGIRAKGRTTVGVRAAPKPPPERLSLTLEAINSAEEVWLSVAGSDKAGAVGLALAGAGPVQVPAAGAHGRKQTLWLLDHDAAAKVPGALIQADAAEAGR